MPDPHVAIGLVVQRSTTLVVDQEATTVGGSGASAIS